MVLNKDKAIIRFLDEQFGKHLGKMLFQNYLKSLGYDLHSPLSPEKKLDMTETMIRKIYSRYVKPEEVNRIVMNLRMTYCLSNSLGSTIASKGENLSVDKLNIKDNEPNDMKKFFSTESDDCFTVKTDIKGDYKGIVVLLVSNDELFKIMGFIIEDEDSAEVKLTDITELKKTLQRFFFDLAKKIQIELKVSLSKNVIFSEPEILFENEDNYVSKMIRLNKTTPKFKEVVLKLKSSEFSFSVTEVNIKGTFIFIEEEIEGMIDSLMKKLKDNKQEFTDILFAESGGNGDYGDSSRKMDADLVKVLSDYKPNAHEIITKLKYQFGIEDFNNAPNRKKIEFVEELLEKNFYQSSPQVRGLVKAGCKQAIGIKQD